MPPYQVFSMVTRLVCAVLCCALTLLVGLQLRRDHKSMLFARLTAVIAGIALDGLLLRIVWVMGGDIFALFTLAGVLTGTVPVLTYVFTNEYLDTWTPRRRLMAQFLGACLGAAALVGMSLHLYSSVTISPEGFIVYEMYPWTIVLLGAGGLGSLLTIRILFLEYRKRHAKTNTRLLIGIGIVSCGVLMLSTPGLGKYTLEQVLYAIGAFVIAGTVFKERLFNPLMQLNTQLERRASQLSAIMVVSQKALSQLTLEVLLEAITQDIQAAFGYAAVSVYLPDEKRNALIARAASHNDAAPITLNDTPKPIDSASTVGMAALTRQPARLSDIANAEQNHSGLDGANQHARISIPLMIGAATPEATLVGVLDIQGDTSHPFDKDDVEVLQILSNQIAMAIHHAELFERMQAATQTADEASRQKTRFIAAMSHELRTPLQTIITRSGWMLNCPEQYSNVPLPDSYREDMTSLYSSAQHLHSLINNILDLSKIEAGEIDLELSAVDPLPILRNVLETSQSLVRPGVTLEARYAEQLSPIWADELRVQQVLSNLVSNSCKFCERGKITVDATSNGRMLRFTVTDTGIGIPRAAQPALFNRFKQATSAISRQYGGSGLGLSICQQLVQLQGGDIGFESEPGRGSTFYFTLPLATAQPLSVCSASATRARAFIFPTAVQNLPLQILLIDACSNTQLPIQVALSKAGYKVLFASTSEQAIAWASAVNPEIAVVVLEPDSVSSTALSDLSAHTSVIEVRVGNDLNHTLDVLLKQVHQRATEFVSLNAQNS